MPPAMDAALWITAATTLVMVAAMATNAAGPDLIFMAGLVAFLATGIVDVDRGLQGFSNPSVLTVGALFVVAAGVRETGLLDQGAERLLGRPTALAWAQLRLMASVSAVSAFLNNTPVVAVTLPLVTDWARRTGLGPSRLLMPLSYAAILGGTCTLIGTSTNLIVAGMGAAHGQSFGLFDLCIYGLPILGCGIAYVLLASPWLLPAGGRDQRVPDAPREYMVAMRVDAASPIAGKSIEQAGLRQLPGLYLAEVEREGVVMPAVGPQLRLCVGDRLLFVGLVDSVVDLRKVRGIVPDTNQVHKLLRRPDRRLVEAVVGARSVLVGKNAREVAFRTRYNAAIIAVRRHGERIVAKIGDIRFLPGDTLLLETHPSFLRNHRNDDNFALVSEVANSTPPRRHRAPAAAAILVAMVATQVFGMLDLLTAALMACGGLIASGCISGHEARRSLNLPVLVAIAASLGVSEAVEASGAATLMARGLLPLAAPWGALGLLAALYVFTSGLSSLINNNAAAALMFPVFAAVAQAEGIPIKVALVVLMIAASTSFSTPVGYQTNLMVVGPGRYRFADFVRFGLPLQVLCMVVTLTIVSAQI